MQREHFLLWKKEARAIIQQLALKRYPSINYASAWSQTDRVISTPQASPPTFQRISTSSSRRYVFSNPLHLPKHSIKFESNPKPQCCDQCLTLHFLIPRLSPSANTSRRTAKTRTPSSASFSSSRAFTVCRGITRLWACCLRLGGMRARRRVRWWLSREVGDSTRKE